MIDARVTESPAAFVARVAEAVTEQVEARETAARLERVGDPRGWRDPGLVWPGFAAREK